MLVESDYLKMQIRKMEEAVDENDPGAPYASHHAYDMVRSTLYSIKASIYAIEQYTRRATMRHDELIAALRRLKVETGSLACLGCGHEHNCSTQGCAILREAVEELEEVHDGA